MTEDEFYAVVSDLEDGNPVDAEKRKEVNEMMDTRMCCNGYMCGCYGATFRDYYEHCLKERDPSGFQKYVENGRVI